MKEALAVNGYPRWAYDLGRFRPTPPTATSGQVEEPPTTQTTIPEAAPTSSRATEQSVQNPVTTGTSNRRGHVTLPYHSGLTEPLSRILRKNHISSSVRSRGSVREILVKPKDKLPPEDKTGVVYVGSCASANGIPCGGHYIGETGRTLKARIDEHFSTALRCPGQCKSSVMQHAREFSHHFRKSDFKIIDSEENNFRRGVKESIYIRALNPSINEHPGRHLLPPNYDHLIKAQVKIPSPPAVHDAENETILDTTQRRPGRPRKPNSTSSQTTQETASSQQQQQQQPSSQTIPMRIATTSHHMITRRRALSENPDGGTPG